MPNTWLRVAPTHLSSASWRTRWATRIEKVLAITMMPTNRAMAAKPSSTYWMELVLPVICFMAACTTS